MHGEILAALLTPDYDLADPSRVSGSRQDQAQAQSVAAVYTIDELRETVRVDSPAAKLAAIWLLAECWRQGRLDTAELEALLLNRLGDTEEITASAAGGKPTVFSLSNEAATVLAALPDTGRRLERWELLLHGWLLLVEAGLPVWASGNRLLEALESHDSAWLWQRLVQTLTNRQTLAGRRIAAATTLLHRYMRWRKDVHSELVSLLVGVALDLAEDESLRLRLQKFGPVRERLRHIPPT